MFAANERVFDRKDRQTVPIQIKVSYKLCEVTDKTAGVRSVPRPCL